MAQTIKLKRSGTQGAAPTTSNLALGEVAINTYDGKMYIKKDVGGTESIVEIGGSGSVSYLEAGMIEYEYTATSNQTTFSGSDSNSATLSYTANSVLVFLNGVLQDDGVDYTATNGTSVVFGSALTANDEVRIIAINTVASASSLQDPIKLDAISTVNNQAAYSLTLSSSAYTPSSQNALIVSLNGITQEPGDSFTISGSTITFSPALVTGDVVDYIVDMGRTVTIGQYDSDLVVTGDITPGADSTYDLGASGTEWANVYADTFTGNLTGNVTGTVSSLSNHDTDDLSEGSTNLYFTTARVNSHLSGGTGVTYNAGEISIGQDVGTTATPTFGNITTTGYIAGPSTFTIDPAAVGDNTGTLVVAGNLQVDGTTTTINSTTMTVDDLNITLASGAANAAAANGAGITVDGASASLTYNGTNDNWNFNKPLIATKLSSSDGVLELDDNGTHNGIINVPATLLINIDSDNNNTGESFRIAKDRTGTSGGTELFRVQEDGKVGIGTDSPARILHIEKDGLADLLLRDTSTYSVGTGPAVIFQGNDSGSTITQFGAIYGVSNGSNSGELKFETRNSGSSAEHMRIDSAGRVGIGTTSPDEKLVVNGNLAFSYNTSISAYTIGKASDAYGIEYYSGVTSDSTKIAHTFSSAVNSNILSITYGGTVGIGVTNPTGATLEIQSNAGANALKLRARTNDDYSFIQFYDNAGTTLRGQIANHNGDFNFYTGSSGTIRAKLNTSGHLAIGNTNATYILDVDAGAPASSDQVLGRFSSQNGIRDIGFVWDDSESTLGIATLTNHALVFHTNGNSNERMRITSTGTVRIDPNGTTAGLSSLAITTNAMTIGDLGTFNLAFDSNELQSRNNGASNNLILNKNGGTVAIGAAETTGGLYVTSTQNRTIILDATFPTGSFTWQSVRRSGSEKFRWFINADDSMSIYSDAGSTFGMTWNTAGDAGITGSDTPTNVSSYRTLELGQSSGSKRGRVNFKTNNGDVTLYSAERSSYPYLGVYTTDGGTYIASFDRDGLKFNGDTAAANALDDYEEGTFTPSFTTSGTLTVNSATYTKIGRQVTCRFYLSASTTCSGDITGLPFTPNGESAGVVGYQNHVSGETIGILVQGANVWNLRIGSTQYGLTAGKQIRGMFTYFTDA